MAKVKAMKPKAKGKSKAKGAKVVKIPAKVFKKSSNKTKPDTVNKAPKLTIPKSPFKQSEFFMVLAEQTALSKKDVKGVLEAIQSIAEVHLKKSGPGQLTIPGLCKVVAVNKPATKAKKGRNPFTGEEMIFKAKPARRVIKIKPLKKFKAEVE